MYTQIDGEADKRFLGWVVAANPVGQLLSAPLVGWLSSRWNSVRWLCMATSLLNSVGFMIYASLSVMPGDQKYWMIFSRFIIGVAGGPHFKSIDY